MSAKTSFVWTYFTSLSKFEVSCDVCKENGRETKLKRSGNSTSSMSSHLKSQHNITEPTKEEQAAFTAKRKQSQPSVNKYFKSELSLGGYLAKWAAKDNFSVKGIIGCNELRIFLTSRNMTMPKSGETVWKLIEGFYQENFDKQTEELKGMIQRGSKFSISIDEWTDLNQRRYLMLFAHDSEHSYNLGLIPIPPGNATEEVLHELIVARIAVVGIDPQVDLVGCSSDAASTMPKLTKHLQITGQLCVNHCFHLAVTDVVYRKIKKTDHKGEKLIFLPNIFA